MDKTAGKSQTMLQRNNQNIGIKLFGMHRAKRILIALVVCAMASGAGVAQQPKQEPPAREEPKTSEASGAERNPAGVLVASHEDYRIGPSDVLEIKVLDASELSGTFVVNAVGSIPMPYLGEMKVQSKTPQELAKLIADGLRGDYLKDPRVTVTVTQYNSRSFYIQGAVRKPDVYKIMGKVSLFKLINVAGGLTENHGSTAFIIREIKQPEGGAASSEEAEKYEMKQVNINSLYKGNFDQNVMVEPGDIINIPIADVFFIGGEVRKPGQFPLKEGTTLRQAIALAQGTTFEAAKDRGLIFREDTQGRQQDVKVDIGAVMAGKKSDIAIKANDIIIIPNSRMKSVGGALLRALGMGTVQRGVVY